MSQATGGGKVRPLETSSQGCTTAYLLHSFDIGGTTLKPEHKRFLEDTVAETLKGNQEHKVRLLGRASRSGSNELNMRLSRQRVEAVAKCLTDAGADPSQVQTDFIGESAPLSTSNESGEDRSVEVHLQIAKVFTVLLRSAFLVSPTPVLIATIREALEPLASQAGRELKIAQPDPGTFGEVSLEFDPGGRDERPCTGLLILGNEGGGSIFVGAHESLRVCGIPKLDLRNPRGAVDHVSQLKHVFENGEEAFARFVGNTCVHELAHLMAQLEHSTDPRNFLFSAGASGGNLPREQRTFESMRRHWAGRRLFDVDQTKKLVCAIQTANYTGGMCVKG